MKKKKPIIIILIIIVLLAIIIGIGYIYGNKNKNKTYTSVTDFKDVKELVEYYGCEYKKMESSKEKGFDKDIYLIFAKDPIDEETGYIYKSFYENIISLVSAKMNKKDFRMIDETRDIVIKVVFNDDDTISYMINDDRQYFANLKSKKSIEKVKEDPEIIKTGEWVINSGVLKSIIANGWIKKDAVLGTPESTSGEYEIYWDEGYKIRSINTKVFNIVFLPKYNTPIIGGVTSGMSNEEIINLLGTPQIRDNNENLIGYKTEDLYVFCHEGEISIYGPDEYDEEKNEEFAAIFTELNRTGDYNEFLNRLTDLYPDYYSYIKSTSYASVIYPQRGFEINFNAAAQNGLTIYNNYKGKITSDITIDEVKNGDKLPANTLINVNENLVKRVEDMRLSEEISKLTVPDNDHTRIIMGTNYVAYILPGETILRFTPTNNELPESEVKEESNKITTVYEYSENRFVYGVKGKGIYLYDAKEMKKYTVIESTGECKITDVKDGTIYYDGTSVKI